MSNISLAQGGGGEEFEKLVFDIRAKLKFTGRWENMMDDGATLSFSDIQSLCGYRLTPPNPPCEGGKLKDVCDYQFSSCNPAEPPNPAPSPKAMAACDHYQGGSGLPHLVFTTDGFVVDPLFFNGGDIGKISFCGTVNDLAMMGAVPLGLSLSMIIEEGLDQEIVDRVLESINKISQETQIPIATGDTKVMGKGQIDKMVITTAGVGITDKVIKDSNINIGDKIIVSGSLGEHGATLLANRFNYETNLQSDCRPLTQEILAVKNLIKAAKDITRGGIAAIFNEMASKAKMRFVVDEAKLPFRDEVVNLSKILGISQYSLACEGRFVCIALADNAAEVEKLLQEFNQTAAIVGEVVEGSGVLLTTDIGQRVLEPPKGKLVPRIC